MKVKVCGLCAPDNIEEVLALGLDYVGFIFYKKSKRFVGKTKLAEWVTGNEGLFGKTKKVGIFVNAELDYILNAVHDYKLDYVQLHGDESPGYCRELKLLWSVSTLRKAHLIKAFSITPDFDFKDTYAYADSCPLFIFDTGGHAEKGGTGAKWDWTKIDEYEGLVPFLLSGGIGPEDAERVSALKHVQLQGVDLNSGFELKAGVKNAAELQRFLAKIK
jgi:phosphoribosylanthranilate isomerase